VSSFTPWFTITNAITAGLTSIERTRGFLEAATLSDEWVRRMSQRALLLEAHHTTRIDGTRLTFEQSERLWTGQSVAEAPADDMCELLNYREAFTLVAEYLKSGEPVTEGLIREIHRRLVDGVRGGQDGPGAYRTVQNYVVNSRTRAVTYTPPSPGDVPPLMRDFVAWLRAESAIHPVLVAGIAQYPFVHIYPFLDGNGRTARLLSTLCLYRAGYDFKRLFTLSEYYDRDRKAFYQVIRNAREQGMDLTGWLEFFVGGLATQLAEVKARCEAAIRHGVVVKTHRLNPRQARAIEHLQEAPSLNIRTFEGLCPDASRRTLQRSLEGLEQKGLLRHEGKTDNPVYRLRTKL
jgi:Fic family protein